LHPLLGQSQFIERAIALRIFSLWAIVAVAVAAFAEGHSAVRGQVLKREEATELTFDHKDHWDYRIEDVRGALRITVPTLNAETRKALTEWKDDLISSVEVVGSTSEKDVITIKTKPGVEFFDYLTDTPARVIVDLFPGEMKKTKRDVATVSKRSKAAPSGVSPKGQESALRKSNESKDSQSEGVATVQNNPTGAQQKANSDQGDAASADLSKGPSSYLIESTNSEKAEDRFDLLEYEVKREAIIRSEQMVYLRFPVLMLEGGELQEIKSHPPEYEMEPDDTRENKQARLLLLLFKKGRFAVYLKALQLFRQEFPTSKYDQILDFIKADIDLQLAENEQDKEGYGRALDSYRGLLVNYPESPLFDRTSQLLVFSYLKEKQALKALSQIQSFLVERPDSSLRSKMMFAAADAYRMLNRYSKALDVYNEIEKLSQDRRIQARAAYQKGDLYFLENKYKQATEAYEGAVKNYPEFVGVYENAIFNRAESQFWLGNSKTALEGYREFLRLFPKHINGGFCLTRIGEILEQNGVNKERSLGAYLESEFKYRGSPGAAVAKIRTLGSQLATAKPQEVGIKIDTILDLASEIPFASSRDFAEVIITDALYERKNFEDMISRLETYYKSNAGSPHLGHFKNRIVQGIVGQLKESLDNPNKVNTLRIFAKNSDSWLKNSSRSDVPYILGMGYFRLGLYKESAREIGLALSQVEGLSDIERIRLKAFEELPAIDIMRFHYSKALFESGELLKSYEVLDKIKGSTEFNDEQRAEVATLLAQIQERRGDFNLSDAKVVEMLKANEGVTDNVVRVVLSVAQNRWNNKDRQGALDLLKMSQEQMSVDSDEQKRALTDITKRLHEYQIQEGEVLQAAATIERCLNKLGDTTQVPELKFLLGKSYIQMGEIRRAEEIFQKIDGNEASYWSSLAKDQMNQVNFEDSYKKYLKRIPALSDFKKSSAKKQEAKP